MIDDDLDSLADLLKSKPEWKTPKRSAAAYRAKRAQKPRPDRSQSIKARQNLYLVRKRKSK